MKEGLLDEQARHSKSERTAEQQPAKPDYSSDPSASEQARKLALAIVGAGLDRKASGVEILDVCGKVDYAELLVLMTGRSDRHVHAIAKGVQRDLKTEHGVVPLSIEGMTAATWVLIDYNDVVVHVFQQDARVFYDLEGLWLDAGRMNVPHPKERKSDVPRSE